MGDVPKNPENTGFNPQTPGPTGEPSITWSVEKDSAFYASPAVVDNTVYAVTNSGGLFAINSNGVVEWSQQVSQGNNSRYNLSSPAVVNGVVYVGSADNQVYAVSAANGEIIWKIGTGAEIQSSPTVLDGSIYIGNNNGKLFALNSQDGSVRWTFEISGEIRATPAVAGDLVLIGIDGSPYRESDFFALNTDDGSIEWEFSADGSIRASASIAGDLVCIGDTSGVLYALDIRDGTEKWKFSETSGSIDSTIAVDGSHVFTVSGNNLYSITHSGMKNWDFPLGYNSSDVALSKTHAYVGKENTLISIDKNDGTSRWRVSTEGSAEGVPAVAGDHVYIGDRSGFLYAIGGDNSASTNTNSEDTSNMTTISPDLSDGGQEGGGEETSLDTQTDTVAGASQEGDNSYNEIYGLGILAFILLLIGRVLDLPIKAHKVWEIFRGK